ncbi:MAG TPA: 50S ribosomal protein L11 methyltransferase [Solirubrobacteraceae bacterium]
MRELAIRVPAGAVEAVLDDLLAIAPHGVHEVARGDEVELRLRGDEVELPPRAAVAAAAGAWGASLSERDVPDDWPARRAADHEPLIIAGRLAVRPAWAPPPADGLIDVVLAHRRAFGSGGHPTTRACLEALCALKPAGSFADLGCGAGLLAIGAAKLGWAPVAAIDVQEEAVEAVRANAARNGVLIDAWIGDLAHEPPPPAAALAANVPPALHEAIAARLEAPPDVLIASGILEEEADRVQRAYAGAGLREADRSTTAGWAVLVLRSLPLSRRASARRRPRRRQAPRPG